jgi:hypothetical protein
MGRPLKFQSPEDLQAKIDAYFGSCLDDEGKIVRPITISGLALALDTSRETLCDYQHRDEFSDTVARAKLRVEQYAEEQLYVGKNSSGPIFALKNFGWKDQHQVESTGKDGGPIETKNATTHTATPELIKAIVQQVRNEF